MSDRIYRTIIAVCGIFLITLGLLYLSESTNAVATQKYWLRRRLTSRRR